MTEDAERMTEFANVREILGGLIGRSVLDITQDDRDASEEIHRIYLHFDNGRTLVFYEGFEYDGL